MTTTDKLLRRTQPVALKSSFLYVSAAEICDCKKDEWIALIEKVAEEERPDFVFFSKACCAEKADLACLKVTAGETPAFIDKGGVHYVILPDRKTDGSCAAVKADLEKLSGETVVFVNGQPCEDVMGSVSAAACVYGSCKHDYAVKENGVWYMNTAAFEKGGIRKVGVTVDGDVVSSLRYFADKREILYKSNWKTVLFGRGSQGRPMADSTNLYIPTADDGNPKQCGVYKLDAKGGIVWKFPTENSVNCDLAQTDKTVMAVDCEANVYFICKECAKLVGKIKLPFKGRYANAATTCYGNVAYVSLKGTVYAIDMEKQAVVWEYTEGGCKTQAPVVAGKLLLCSGENGFYALCAKTGSKVWENTDIRACAKALPLVSGRILLPADDTALLLDGETGKTLAGKKAQGVCFNVPAQPLLRGDTVYLGTDGNGVVSVDMSDIIRAEAPEGVSETEILASYPLDCGKKTVVGDVMYIDGHIVFTTADGFMYMTNVSTGENKKYLDTLSAVSAAPTFIRVKKPGRNSMEAYVVTSSLCGKIFGNRL